MLEFSTPDIIQEQPVTIAYVASRSVRHSAS